MNYNFIISSPECFKTPNRSVRRPCLETSCIYCGLLYRDTVLYKENVSRFLTVGSCCDLFLYEEEENCPYSSLNEHMDF